MRKASIGPTMLAGRSVLAVPLIRHLPAPLVLAACALMVAAGCGSEDGQSTRKSASVRAEVTPSPDLAGRVVATSSSDSV